jgi:hypothetical protein
MRLYNACKKAEPGNYSDVDGTGECKICQPGFFQPDQGMHSSARMGTDALLAELLQCTHLCLALLPLELLAA